jgi:nitrite reductase (NADH) small subunit
MPRLLQNPMIAPLLLVLAGGLMLLKSKRKRFVGFAEAAPAPPVLTPSPQDAILRTFSGPRATNKQLAGAARDPELSGARPRKPMAFVRAVAAGDIPAGTIREVDVNGKALALANVGGTFHAIDNTCIHRGGPLGDGPLEGKIVTCPWHGWQYDVTTGKVAQNPAVGVACYPVELRGSDVYVDLG